MRKIVFIILFATLFVACDKIGHEDNPITPTQIIQEEPFFNENKTFTVDKGGTKITYICRIGNDFDSALDSLIRRYEPILNTAVIELHYSGEGLIIDKQKINVDFSYDNRSFVLLTISDKANIYRVLFTSDVIDEKGNYYTLICPED